MDAFVNAWYGTASRCCWECRLANTYVWIWVYVSVCMMRVDMLIWKSVGRPYKRLAYWTGRHASVPPNTHPHMWFGRHINRYYHWGHTWGNNNPHPQTADHHTMPTCVCVCVFERGDSPWLVMRRIPNHSLSPHVDCGWIVGRFNCWLADAGI